LGFSELDKGYYVKCNVLYRDDFTTVYIKMIDFTNICQSNPALVYTVYSSKQFHTIYINAKFSAECTVHLERKEDEDEKKGNRALSV